jgi:hypothetical protein
MRLKTNVMPIFLALLLAASCAKQPAAAPVPGTINTFDAFAARTIGDAQAALVGAKTWELCSDANFPPTVTFDTYTNSCDPTAGKFPAVGRPILYKAEQSYNIALAAAQSYHAGASSDTAGLTQALTTLGIDIGTMLTGIGKGK